jgi:hypothetical protein
MPYTPDPWDVGYDVYQQDPKKYAAYGPGIYRLKPEYRTGAAPNAAVSGYGTQSGFGTTTTYGDAVPEAPDAMVTPSSLPGDVTSSSLTDGDGGGGSWWDSISQFLPDVPGVDWGAIAPGGDPFIDWSQLGQGAASLTSNVLFPLTAFDSQRQARNTLEGAAETATQTREQALADYLRAQGMTPQDYISADPFLQDLQQQYLTPEPYNPIPVPQGLYDVAGSMDQFGQILNDITAPGIQRGRQRMARYGLENSNIPFEQMYVSATGATLFPALQQNVIGASQAIGAIENYNRLNETQRMQLHNDLGKMLAESIGQLRGQDLNAAVSVLNTALSSETDLYGSLASMPTPEMAAALAFLLGRQMTEPQGQQPITINNNLGGTPGGGTPGGGGGGGTSPSDFFQGVRDTFANVAAGAGLAGSMAWNTLEDAGQWLAENLGITPELGATIANVTEGMSADGAALVVDMVNNGATPDVAANLLNAGQYLQADGTIAQIFDPATGVGLPGTWVEGMNADQFLPTGPPAPEGAGSGAGAETTPTNWGFKESAAAVIGHFVGNAINNATNNLGTGELDQFDLSPRGRTVSSWIKGIVEMGGAFVGNIVLPGGVGAFAGDTLGNVVGGAEYNWGAQHPTAGLIASPFFPIAGVGAVTRLLFGAGEKRGLSSGTKDFISRASSLLDGVPGDSDEFRALMDDGFGWKASEHGRIDNKIMAEFIVGLTAMAGQKPETLSQIFTGNHDGGQALLLHLGSNDQDFQTFLRSEGGSKEETDLLEQIKAAEREAGTLDDDGFKKKARAMAEMLRQVFAPEEE